MKDGFEPCPFCGSEDIGIDQPRTFFYATCGDCNSAGPVSGTEDDSVTAWNRRAAPADVGEDGLRHEIDCLNHRIAVMQNELNMRHAKDTGDVWYWQGDGSDNPATMVNSLTVVINAADLRAQLAARGQGDPVAWMVDFKRTPNAMTDRAFYWVYHPLVAAHVEAGDKVTPLYATPQPAALPEKAEMYTCIGKGGTYELLGRAKPAGVLRDMLTPTEYVVYGDVEARGVFVRTADDFAARMKLVTTAPAQGDLQERKS